MRQDTPSRLKLQKWLRLLQTRHQLKDSQPGLTRQSNVVHHLGVCVGVEGRIWLQAGVTAWCRVCYTPDHGAGVGDDERQAEHAGCVNRDRRWGADVLLTNLQSSVVRVKVGTA